MSLFSNKNLQYYYDKGIIGEMDEMFNNQGRLKEILNGILYFNMRGSEIINRIASYTAAETTAPLDMIRKGLGASLALPDVQQAIRDQARLITDHGNFLYGTGFKSKFHGDSALGEYLMTLNTFAQKSASVMVLDGRRWRLNQPEFVNQMARINSPPEFVQYLDMIEPEMRNTFWRALATQVTAGAMLSTIVGTYSFWNQLNPGSALMPGVPPWPVRIAHLLEKFGKNGIFAKEGWKQLQYEATPLVERRREQGRTTREKIFGPPQRGGIWERFFGAAERPGAR
jgi:hypothetical protein